MRTREIKQGKDGVYRLWVLMSTRKLGMLDNTKYKHITDPTFTTPIWVQTAKASAWHEIKKVLDTAKYKEEWV
jgi:hypothetical protein